MKRSATITIHPEALQNNLRRAKEAAPHAKANAVIKANAYGHGAIETAGILYQLSDGFAVSCLPEAIELRQAGIDLPITVLQGHQNMDDLRAAEHFKLRLIVHNKHQLSLLDQYSKSFRFDIGLKIDTGMHRLGFKPEDAKALYSKLKKHTQVSPKNLMMLSHFSCADEPQNDASKHQIDTFKQACKDIPLPQSMANSAGILAWENSHADWIRPGIMLYGSSPFGLLKGHQSTDFQLQAAMTLNSTIIAVHSLKKGDSIGYAATWQCPKDMRVAVLACGYADGYPRHAASGTPVWINGYEVSLVGRVSMDMIVIDIDSTETGAIQIGDSAELWGKNLSVDRIAQHATTISYELLCNAGNLCKRSGA